jgi:hypothetical protein
MRFFKFRFYICVQHVYKLAKRDVTEPVRQGTAYGWFPYTLKVIFGLAIIISQRVGLHRSQLSCSPEQQSISFSKMRCDSSLFIYAGYTASIVLASKFMDIFTFPTFTARQSKST